MYKFEYNKNEKQRDALLNKRIDMGDIFWFEPITVETLKTLLDEKFADPDEKQNEAPTVREIYDFIVEYPEYKAHGYATSLSRGDYRVSLEGVIGKGKNVESVLAFSVRFRDADEFDVSPERQRAWYD